VTGFIIFTYTQLRNATHDFSFELGRGSSAVIYKGILSDGREVAVKRIYLDTTSCNEVYEKEVRFTAMLQHVNVMKLIGCCSTEEESFQVYELMHNGTLGDHIHGTIKDSGLPWPVRFQIIEGIAQGLLYLHQQCGLRIVHMDIKPNNILLDDDYIPKITDFGISEVLSALAHEEETGVVRGTPGFVDPELVTNRRFSAKTDVYGYGVLLLETISGKSCIQADSDFNILSAWAWYLWKERKLAEFIDPRVRGVADVSETKEIKRCIHIALLCIELNPADRPTMSDILQMLWDNKLKLPAPQNPAGTNEVS